MEESLLSHVSENHYITTFAIVALADKSLIHILPHGIHHESPTKCLLGNGVVIEPRLLLADLNNLKANGISFNKKLMISER